MSAVVLLVILGGVAGGTGMFLYALLRRAGEGSAKVRAVSQAEPGPGAVLRALRTARLMMLRGLALNELTGMKVAQRPAKPGRHGSIKAL